MALFSKKDNKKITTQDAVQMVEQFLQKVGLNPSQHRIEDPSAPAWGIVRGSAQVYISVIHRDEGDPFLRIYSPMLYLPSDNILPFYRRCLEINKELFNCALSVHEDKVLLISQRSILGLDPEELEGTLNFLSSVADDLDNKLADEFGAKMCGLDPEPR
jgi:hypothetical protein